jgi:hypothetical protein
LVATVTRKTRQHLRELSACIGAPRPHDFAVRRHAARRIGTACVHRIPPHVRDERETPLLPRRDAVKQSRFRKKRNRNIFALELDDTYRIDRACKLGLLAQAISRPARRKARRDMPEIELIARQVTPSLAHDGRSPDRALSKAGAD